MNDGSLATGTLAAIAGARGRRLFGVFAAPLGKTDLWLTLPRGWFDHRKGIDLGDVRATQTDAADHPPS
jgi:hypothetical protein